MNSTQTVGKRQKILRSTTKPKRVRVNPDDIPDELKVLPRWVGWTWDWTGRKWDKPPINIATGSKGKSNDHSTWTGFEDAYAAYRRKEVDGVGVVLGRLENGQVLSGVDLDDVRDPNTGELTDAARKVITGLRSYTDVSPTGTGCKILVFGEPPHAGTVGFAAFYTSQYFTVTGHQVPDTPCKVRRCPKTLAEVYRSLNGKSEQAKAKPQKSTGRKSARAMTDRPRAIKALAEISPERARGHDDWVHVGMSLHSVDPELLSEWIRWSRRSDRWLLENDQEYADENPDGKFDRAVCQRKWESFSDDRDTQWTIGSLIHWAKEDGALHDEGAHHGDGHGDGDDDDDMHVRRFAGIRPRKVRWLWQNRIAVGKLTVLSGDPAAGKSFVFCDMAARISQGHLFPDGAVSKQGDVLIISSEDDPSDTLRPRLDAHGANVSRIHDVTMTTADGQFQQLDIAIHLDQLGRALDRHMDTRLLIFDPLTAFMGNVDGNSNTEVRRVLGPLCALARTHKVAVLGISHLSKKEQRAVARTLGSMAFVAAARANWLIMRDPKNRDRRLLLQGKNNLADASGLAFRIEDGKVVWEPEPVDIDPDTVGGRAKEPTKMEEGIRLLEEMLREGSVPTATVLAMAQERGISERTIKRARQELGLVSYQEDHKWWLKYDDE